MEGKPREFEDEYQAYLEQIEKCDSPIVRSGALGYEEWLECRDELKELNACFQTALKGVQ